MPSPPLAVLLAAALLAGGAAGPSVAQEAVGGDVGGDVGAAPAGGAPAGEAAPADDVADDSAGDPVAAWAADPARPLEAEGLDLAAFEYAARPLVVFADSPRDPNFAEQMRLLAADTGPLAERDVAVIVDVDPEARSAVRQALRPRGFGVVLIDKDGGVALRQPDPTTVRELSHAIDRSPIRRDELRLGREGGGS